MAKIQMARREPYGVRATGKAPNLETSVRSFMTRLVSGDKRPYPQLHRCDHCLKKRIHFHPTTAIST